ncbi:hypothetical protein VTL71DRAFT_9749 [Oculimacula yallundae]|uniref:Uncharacterized protein n=1 Tax=Oculimacula yallundae TaxID=86028 RepID=A0ABR4BRS3_9HELO
MLSFIFYVVAAFCAIIFASILSSSSRATKTCSLPEIASSAPAPSSSSSSSSAPSTPEPSFPALQSCFRRTSLPTKKSVRFITQDPSCQLSADIVDVLQYDVHHDNPFRPVDDATCIPHTPGQKWAFSLSDGSIKMCKQLGSFDVPSFRSSRRPRCKNLIHYNECLDCRRPPIGGNTFLFDHVPSALPRNVPVFQVASGTDFLVLAGIAPLNRVVYTLAIRFRFLGSSIPCSFGLQPPLATPAPFASPSRGQSHVMSTPPPHPLVPDTHTRQHHRQWSLPRRPTPVLSGTAPYHLITSSLSSSGWICFAP